MREGLVRAPEYLPEWARDLSYLTAFMSYSAFLGECDLGAEARRYDDLSHGPRTRCHELQRASATVARQAHCAGVSPA